ncbi:MAG: cob(I)yrinic acid a,c-diamide adenosyltransferase [Acidobacteriota bacterium]
MSISTKKGDSGKTSLVGGRRVSKGDGRVEAYGTVDELIAAMGFARSICEHEEVSELTREIQRELFAVSAAIATPASDKERAEIPSEKVDALTAHVRRIEGMDGMLDDWAMPGEHPVAAAFDVARTVCRRAEREVVRLVDAGEEVGGNVLPYLNRLSDLLWLFSRLIEKEAGRDASLRGGKHRGRCWSRAW